MPWPHHVRPRFSVVSLSLSFSLIPASAQTLSCLHPSLTTNIRHRQQRLNVMHFHFSQTHTQTCQSPSMRFYNFFAFCQCSHVCDMTVLSCSSRHCVLVRHTHACCVLCLSVKRNRINMVVLLIQQDNHVSYRCLHLF